MRLLAIDVVVPAVVLAEGLFTGHPGHDFHLARLLAVLDIVDVDRELGLASGRLRQEALRSGVDANPSAVDSVVVAVADARAAHDDVVIVSSDVDDIMLLGAMTVNAHRLAVQPA